MNSGTTSPLSPTDAAAASFTYQSLGSLRDLALVSSAVVFGPLLIYGFWTCLSNWGWWRVARTNHGDMESGKLTNRRRQYIRTWHGWVEMKSSNYSPEETQNIHSGRLPGSSRLISPRPAVSLGQRVKDLLKPRTTTTDYNRIFWDPRTQEERVAPDSRFWWQKWLNGNTERIDNRLNKEKGFSRSRKSIYRAGGQPWIATTSDQAVGLEGLSTGLQAEDNDTVRRRTVADNSTDLWCFGSEETERATWLQLFYPRQRRTYPMEDCTPEKVFNDLESGLATAMPKTRPSLSQRTVSGLRFPTPPLTRHLSAILRWRTSLMSDTNLKTPSRSSEPAFPFLQARSTLMSAGGPGPPRNSAQEHNPRSTIPQNEDVDLPVEQRTMMAYTGRAASSSYVDDFADNLARSLDVWASPMIVDLHNSSSRCTSGISGRRGSPAMGWRTIEDQPETLFEDLSNYEVEGSVDQSNPGSSSSSINIRPAGHLKMRTVSAGDGILLTPGTSPCSLSQSPFRKRGHNGGDANAFGHVLAKKPVLRASSLPPIRPVRSGSRPDRTLHASLSRSRSVGAPIPSRPTNRNRPDMAKVTGHRSTLSILEKTFLNDLDRKLNWLHHELSPGFRSPEDNPAETFYVAAATTSNGRLIGEARTQGEFIPTSTRRSTSSKRPHPKRRLSVRRTLSTPNIDSWRCAMNRFRKATWHCNDAELLNAITQFEGSASLEQKEGTIDTAAWILRRPPQGWPTSKAPLAAQEHLITGHHDWEKIRRPIRIVKRQGSMKSITPLVRRLSADISNILHIRDNGNSMGRSRADLIRKRHRTTGISSSNDENSRNSFVQTLTLGLHPNEPIRRDNSDPAQDGNAFPMMSGGLSPNQKEPHRGERVLKTRNPFGGSKKVQKPRLQGFMVAQIPVVASGATGRLGGSDHNAADLMWGEEAKMVIFDDVMECGLGV